MQATVSLGQGDAMTVDLYALNALGDEGWEMTGLAQDPPKTYYYFKRQVET